MTGFAEISVRELDVMAEADWDFRTGDPSWQWGNYRRMATFDPFPAYPHHLDDVVEAAGFVQDCFAPAWNVELYVADREEVGRSNGFSYVHAGSHYDDASDKWVQDKPTGLIVLSGKRVPPHPAVSRYLVAHEFGHNVQYMIARYKGHENLHADEWLAAYAELRGLGAANMHPGNGGRWHDSITEIFACDFRILICDLEPGFWPHPGIAHPTQVDGLNRWWQEVADEVSDWIASEAVVSGSAHTSGTAR